jgi:cation diffusion facilitator family transporter
MSSAIVGQTPTSAYRLASRSAWLGLAVNFVLGVVKLVGGLVSGSFALVSDSLHSLSDVVTSLVVLFAIRVAQRPPDREHPYGHSRAEAIAGLVVAVLIVLSALVIGWEAINRLAATHEEVPPTWTLWIASVNVVLKEALYRNKIRVGKRTGSQAIIATAWDHRTDALSALAVLFALAVGRWGGPGYLWADAAAALVVAATILWSGALLFGTSASELMDLQAPESLVAQVRETARGVPGVKDVETLWVRKSGMEYFADIHVEVDPQLTVAEGHRIGHRVKDRLREKFPLLRDALVHLEPFGHRR